MPEKPASERTEQPTPRRLAKAREKGQVPQSQELISAVTLIALLAVTAIFAPELLQWLTNQLKNGFSCQNSVFCDQQTFMNFMGEKIIDCMAVSSFAFAAILGGSILSSIALSGLNFAPEALELKWSEINPASGIQKLINAKTAVNLLISILKLTFVSIIVWVYLRDKLETLAGLRWGWSEQIIVMIAKVVFGASIRICIALFIIGLADAFYQKWKYIDDLKMTKQEVKEDHKATEGSPQTKARIRRVQFSLATKRMLQEVPKANVVLVNPTHVAVAIRYEVEEMDSPVVVAKGADYIAEKIREKARAYGIPIIRRPELARTIYSTVDIGKVIPPALYVAVAEVLAMIYRLHRQKKG